MVPPEFASAVRRVITGDDGDGRSLVIIDGPPANAANPVNPAGLHEIWTDALTGLLDPRERADRGAATPMLCPAHGEVKVRWFVVQPLPEGAAPGEVKPLVREAFKAIGAEDCIADQDRHPAMHRTQSVDVICVLKGDVSLVLDNQEVRLSQGNVVIQRGTAHGWTAHGGPALMLAVLIERGLVQR